MLCFHLVNCWFPPNATFLPRLLCITIPSARDGEIPIMKYWQHKLTIYSLLDKYPDKFIVYFIWMQERICWIWHKCCIRIFIISVVYCFMTNNAEKHLIRSPIASAREGGTRKAMNIKFFIIIMLEKCFNSFCQPRECIHLEDILVAGVEFK